MSVRSPEKGVEPDPALIRALAQRQTRAFAHAQRWTQRAQRQHLRPVASAFSLPVRTAGAPALLTAALHSHAKNPASAALPPSPSLTGRQPEPNAEERIAWLLPLLERAVISDHRLI